MDLLILLPFITIIAFATYVQTVTGFALGMIVMGAVTTFDLVPIAFTSVVISIVTFINGAVALKGNYKAVDLKRVVITCSAMFPAILGGLLVLDYMSSDLNSLLQVLLGLTIIVAGLMIMLKPEPMTKPSGTLMFAGSGAVAGFMAGLFSMAGPPLVYLFYRQPFELKTIRLCLLSIFLLSAVGRTTLVGAQGGLTIDMLTFSVICLPIVTLFTWLGKNYPPNVSPTTLRRLAFFLLIIIGASLVVKNI
ncbi:sulfite exporter TauE/SafE family protein [Amphritea balenae]|uniref:Probable membrane transporter protein n=1 Tax=Amphritea balenae TaxID=452629 RepID=A0A3P1SQF2_9GAMM|nr:sulfite exporter TauE/SafE family protein [Amphritea balenae]RRC99279.1 sulfite exporter TauE/SafE family protein [Amphritea balenae]GGK72436.1 membrane protein [Amphritea balenae]